MLNRIRAIAQQQIHLADGSTVYGIAILFTTNLTLLSLITIARHNPNTLNTFILYPTAGLIMILAAGAALRSLNTLYRKLHDQAAQIASLQAELEAIRARRHTHATAAQLEDLAAVLDDLDREYTMHSKYVRARLKNGAQIIAAGRAGPHTYQSPTTENRPARPGAQVHLWKQ